MAVNISGLRRNIKNVAHNYTDAQVKVREATSNDPWGPSSTMMSEIADLTYNVVAFSEIMQMIWKRLNDQGKNWRHVYKALVLLEYLIKTGSEEVAQQCKENLFAIQTLKDFQYLDDNKDQGINVREKAKSLVALLKDDERLRNERIGALKAKERFAQSTVGIGSDTVYNHTRERYLSSGAPHPHSSSAHSPPELDPNLNPELEAARPQTAGEEELQLQLALAMSREEAEQGETKSKSDDVGLQLALQKSQQADSTIDKSSDFSIRETRKSKPSSDLLDLDFGSTIAPPSSSPVPSTQPAPPVRTEASLDPWGMPKKKQPVNDPWGEANQENNDPWSPVKNETPQQNAFGASKDIGPIGADNDPWTAVKPAPRTDAESAFPASGFGSSNNGNGGDPMDLFSPQAQSQLQEFDVIRNQIEQQEDTNGTSKNGGGSPNPFDLNDIGGMLAPSSSSTGCSPVPTSGGAIGGAKPKKSVQTLLGEHSKLVNLDDLVSGASVPARNPFEQQQQNPFQQKSQKPPMKDLMPQTTWTTNNNQNNQNNEINPFF